MAFETHHRRAIRLKGYDYTQGGAYFVTVCAHERINLFGHVHGDGVKLNEFGTIVFAEWEHTADMRPKVRVADFVVMPNHIHGILVIVDDGDNSCRGVLQYAPTGKPTANIGDTNHSQFKSPSKTIGAIIRGFKSATTKRINQLRKTPHVPVWQRNYYEHIIRNDASYRWIAEYIRLNPARWANDGVYTG